MYQLLLLLLNRFSRVRLCATPYMAAHQAPPSLGFSRQQHWSGLPCPSPMHKSESEVAQSCLILSDPMDCSLPGSSVHGSSQARVLEWGAITFSITFLSFLDYLDPRLHKVLTSFMKSQFLIYFFIGSFWDPPILNSHDTLLSRLMLKTL